MVFIEKLSALKVIVIDYAKFCSTIFIQNMLRGE